MMAAKPTTANYKQPFYNSNQIATGKQQAPTSISPLIPSSQKSKQGSQQPVPVSDSNSSPLKKAQT